MKIRASDEIVLIASKLAHVRIELESPDQLAKMLGATVSSEWPTGEYDRDAMEFFRDRFEEGGQELEGWYSWYAIRDAGPETSALVGAGGYFGPPDADGTVEIGYSILPEWQRRGYATQIVGALVSRAFGFEQVARVIAHTTSSNPGSVAVLDRCGFHLAGPGQEPATIRYEIGRATYQPLRS